jgi:hypothetical protein
VSFLTVLGRFNHACRFGQLLIIACLAFATKHLTLYSFLPSSFLTFFRPFSPHLTLLYQVRCYERVSMQCPSHGLGVGAARSLRVKASHPLTSMIQYEVDDASIGEFVVHFLLCCSLFSWIGCLSYMRVKASHPLTSMIQYDVDDASVFCSFRMCFFCSVFFCVLFILPISHLAFVISCSHFSFIISFSQ